MIQQRSDTSFSTSPIEILSILKRKKYPQVADKTVIQFNFTLLFAKYYLYTQKLLKREINMKEFISKLTSELQIEKLC